MQKQEHVPISTLAKTFFRELLFVFRIAPTQTIQLTLLQLVIGITPPIQLYLAAKTIDVLIRGSENGIWSFELWVLIVISLLLLGLQRVVFLFNDAIEDYLKGYLQVAVNDRIHRKIVDLDLPSLEEPSTHTLLTYLKDQQWRPNQMVYILFQTIGNMTASVSYIILAMAFSYFYSILFVIAVIPSVLISVWAIRKGMEISWGKASLLKKVWYFESLFRRTSTLIELIVHNAGSYFANQYHTRYTEVILKERQIERTRLLGSLVANTGAFIVYVFVYFRIIQSVLLQTISIGEFTLYVGAFVGLERFLINQAWQFAQLFEHTNYLNSFGTLEKMKPKIVERKNASALSSIEMIEFKDVSYAYPDTEIFALIHVSYEIKKGERLAIVGENGAGKSTLVKILMRLYEPTSGAVFVNGEDYRTFTLESLRKQIGVIFQDFEQYALSARENIGIGEMSRMNQMENMSQYSTLF